MDTEDIFEYNSIRKKINGLVVFGVLILASLVILFLFTGAESLVSGTFIGNLITFVKGEIASFSLLGVFLLAMLGGLFFIPLPMEAFFATYIAKNPDTLAVFSLYMLGLTIGYTTNLFVGYRFSNISRNLISVKKFYQIKRWTNRYGKYAVFLSNLIIAPSQQISFIVGVFKYNKYKFWVQFLSGQAIKLLVIMWFVLLFK